MTSAAPPSASSRSSASRTWSHTQSPSISRLAVQFKQSTITNAQAKQLWNTIKYSKVQLEAPLSRLAALNKVKKLDKADPKHKINYALTTTGVRRVAVGVHGEECR